jgi:tRNA threonylcarbamoyladenosine biosynthesis protein TsaE
LCNSEGETARLGAALANALLKPCEGDAGEPASPGARIVALVGSLGAGKTRLVAAVATGLGAERRAVTSPTFVLVHEYPAVVPVYHFDAYRLRDVAEFEELGVDEYFASRGVCFVEWAERVEAVLPQEHLRVEIEIAGATSRKFHFTALGRRYETLLDALIRQVEEFGGGC